MQTPDFLRSDARDYLPLTESTFFILLSLAMKPRHGYGVMKEVLALSRGRINLSAGTLYSALKRLLEQGWITRLDEGETFENAGRPHKTYALTELGRSILNAEIARLDSLVQVAHLQTEERQV